MFKLDVTYIKHSNHRCKNKMRQIRKIEFGITIFKVVIFIICIYFGIIELNLSTGLIYLGVETLERGVFNFYYKRLRKKGEIALVTNSMQNWKKVTIVLLVYIFILSCGYLLYGAELLKGRVIIQFYFITIIAINYLFTLDNGYFYIDQLGFISTSYFSKNYDWKEIDKVELGENTINYKLKEENFTQTISPDSKKEILALNLKQVSFEQSKPIIQSNLKQRIIKYYHNGNN